MRALTLFAFPIFVICFAGLASAQELSPDDFKVGHLELRAPIDSALSHMPKPDYFDLDGTYNNYVGAFYLKGNYDSLFARLEIWETLQKNLRYSDYITAEYIRYVVWYNKSNHLVKGFDIQDSALATTRGVRVGDPSSKLIRLYGNGMLVTDPLTDGPYDHSFHDFSQIRLCSCGDFHIAFFLNHERVSKISVFFRLTLQQEDWSMGFLKLAKPFDAMIAKLPKPDSTLPGDYGSTGFYFPRLVLWRNNETKTLCAMDVYDSSYVTERGLRVGSPSSDIERLYGDRGEVKSVFERFGPYDASFDAYEFATIFPYGRNFLVVLSKAQKVVKILMYVGVDE